jgi:hypothetical protein
MASMISSTVNKHVRSIFPFKSKMFVFASRLQRKHEAPALSILYTIAQEWDIANDTLKACMVTTDSLGQKLTPYTSFATRGKSHALFAVCERTTC